MCVSRQVSECDEVFMLMFLEMVDLSDWSLLVVKFVFMCWIRCFDSCCVVVDFFCMMIDIELFSFCELGVLVVVVEQWKQLIFSCCLVSVVWWMLKVVVVEVGYIFEEFFGG